MRYWLCVLLGFAVATASLVAGAWALYHLTRTGTCASGGPYVSARPCPPGTGAHIVSLIGGVFGVLLAGGIYAARGGDRRRGPVGFGLMLWTLGFLMLAGGTLLGAYGPAKTSSGSQLGAIIVAGVFVPMALIPFLVALFSGRGGEDREMGLGPAPAIQPHAFTGPRSTGGPAVVVGTPWTFGGPTASASNGSNSLDQLEKLAKLHADGALTDAEFAAAKAKILSRS